MALKLVNNLVVVNSVNDFPTPVAGVITLVDNVTYQINGTVALGTNRLVLGASNTLFGLDKSNDKLTYTGTSAMITSTNQDFTIKFLTLAAVTVGGSVFNVTGTTSNNMQMSDNIFGSNQSLGTITGANFCIIDRNLMSGNATGITIAGTMNYFTYADNEHIATAGTCLTITASTFTSIYITRNFFNVTSPSTAINVSISSTVTNGALNNNVFIGTGTYLTGISALTPNWIFNTQVTQPGQGVVLLTQTSLPRSENKSWLRWRASNATVSATGAAGTIAGTLATANQTDSSYTSITQAVSTAGTLAGLTSSSFAELRTQHDPEFTCVISTGSSITNIRYWVGLFTTTPTNVDNLAGSCIAFRFSTVAADTGWKPIVDDGTTQTVGTDIGTVTASTAYKLKFRVDTAQSKTYFSVNGSVEQVVSAIPTATTDLGVAVVTFNTTSGAKTFSFSRLEVIHN